MAEADMKDDIYVMTREQRMKHVAEWKKQVRRL